MSDPIVKVEQGQLRGKIDTDYNGGSYYTFHNIPYAKPPLGELRFKAPQPPEPWEGIRDATKEGDECYSKHMIFLTPVGSENCLILNVYTPDLPKNYNNLKPVMVWIHGGGFTAGSSKVEIYGPEFLICEDVVIVSINYRLGVLGFLSLEDPSLGVPGNAGLKDIVMALKWVKSNIREFNGDPNNVTIFGESAGGAASHYLILSPMGKGLFHRAILQSGCALHLWARGTRCAIELANHLGSNAKTEKEALDVLQKASKEDILKAHFKCKDLFVANDPRPHGPVIEKPNFFEQAFLPDDPINIMISGNYNKVPMLIGYNSREGMVFDIFEKKFKNKHRTIDFEKAVPFTMNIQRESPLAKQIGEKIKNFYYKGEEPSEENIDNYYKLQTDNFFFRGIYSTVKNHLENSDKPIYLYRFAVESSLNLYKNMAKIKTRGVSHSDDLGYLFKMQLKFMPKIIPGSIEEKTIRRCTKLWANFAKKGDPNPELKDNLIPVKWPAVKRDNLYFLNIGENITVGCNPEIDRMEFWDEVFAIFPKTSKL